jgi:Tn3 transposase DDE domain
VTSIERTAYPQFKRLLSARELHIFYTPGPQEMTWAREATDCEICSTLVERVRPAGVTSLRRLLVVGPTGKSDFDRLKRSAPRPSWTNFRAQIDHLRWVDSLGDAPGWVAGIAASKLADFAGEAEAGDAAVMGDYGDDKQVALLAALVHTARTKARDDVAEMFCRRVATLTKRARKELEDLEAAHREVTERLVANYRVLARTGHRLGWWRRFGPASGADPKLEDAFSRYVLTTFTLGSNLGAAQAARHIAGVTAHELGATARRHINIPKLNGAIADVVDAFCDLDLVRAWGDGASVAADGTQIDTFIDNLLAETAIRYGGTGCAHLGRTPGWHGRPTPSSRSMPGCHAGPSKPAGTSRTSGSADEVPAPGPAQHEAHREGPQAVDQPLEGPLNAFDGRPGWERSRQMGKLHRQVGSGGPSDSQPRATRPLY